MKYLCIGINYDQARESIDEHGDPETCSLGDCDGSPVMVLLIRDKDRDPIKGVRVGISMAAACAEHEEEFMIVVKSLGKPKMVSMVIENPSPSETEFRLDFHVGGAIIGNA